MIRIGVPVRIVDSRYVVNKNYVEALQRAHAEAIVILPMTDLNMLIPTLQGLMIPGGYDVDPACYGENVTHAEESDPVIDALDITLIEAAINADLPILGICRGLQIINVALGGSLIQDITAETGSVLDHNFSMTHHQTQKGHRISVMAPSALAALLPETLEVNSYHHQSVKRLAPGLRVTAIAPDGVIEAVEGRKIMAVQWHPERMISDPLFQSLFDDFVRRCSL